MKDFFYLILKAPAKSYEDVIIIVCHDFTLHENQSENQNGTVTRDACDNQTLTVFVASTLYKVYSLSDQCLSTGGLLPKSGSRTWSEWVAECVAQFNAHGQMWVPRPDQLRTTASDSTL